MKKLKPFIIVLCIFFCSTVFAARSFSGKYAIRGGRNLKISLTIEQNAIGKISGDLISATGIDFKLDGMVMDHTAIGTCISDKGKLFFEAEFDGDKLMFTLISPGADGKRDLKTADKLIFVKESDTDK